MYIVRMIDHASDPFWERSKLLFSRDSLTRFRDKLLSTIIYVSNRVYMYM